MAIRKRVHAGIVAGIVAVGLAAASPAEAASRTITYGEATVVYATVYPGLLKVTYVVNRHRTKAIGDYMSHYANTTLAEAAGAAAFACGQAGPQIGILCRAYAAVYAAKFVDEVVYAGSHNRCFTIAMFPTNPVASALPEIGTSNGKYCRN